MDFVDEQKELNLFPVSCLCDLFRVAPICPVYTVYIHRPINKIYRGQ